jgi:type II secretion system protein G
MTKSKSGFTIVELLVVIVVIAILAVITIVAYTGIQARANDSRRLNDLEAIQKALALYKADNGSYPTRQPNPGNSSYEISTDPGFLSSLSSYANNAVFKDPQNSTSKAYWYNTFGAGSYGCPASLGAYYTFWIKGGMQTQSTARIDSGPCTGQTLYVTTPTAGAWTVDSDDYVVFGF